MSKRNANRKTIEKNSDKSLLDNHYVEELKEKTCLQHIQLEANVCVCQWQKFRLSNIVEENVDFFKKFTERVNELVKKIHHAVNIFIGECTKFKNEERTFVEISTKCINSLDKVMSLFIQGIQEFDIMLQNMGKNSEILNYCDSLNCKDIIEKHTLMYSNEKLTGDIKALNNDLTQLINQFLIILLPTTETVKAEKRLATKAHFILRLMCSEAMNVTSSTGIKQTNIMQETQQANKKEKQFIKSSFEFHNKNPNKIIDSNKMVNFEFNSGLKNNSETKDRPKSDRDNAVAAFRYYLHIDLKKFTWNNREFNLHIDTRAFVIISQTSQTIQAKANMSWLRLFGNAVEKPWSEFKKILIEHYYANTGRHLTTEQVNYLRHRFLLNDDSSAISLQDLLTKKYPERHSPRTNEDRLHKKSFTPWHWFVTCTNSLTSQKVNKYWQTRLVYGFISKGYAERILADYDNGTFLVRFAESRIEATQGASPQANFTLAVKQDNQIYHLQDFLTYKELEQRNLDLYETLNEMKIYGTGRKLVSNGKVILSPIEYQKLETQSFQQALANNIEESPGEDEYNAERVNYQVVLRSNNKRSQYTFIPEFNGNSDEFEPPTPAVQEPPTPIFQEDILSPNSQNSCHTIDYDFLQLQTHSSEVLETDKNFQAQVDTFLNNLSASSTDNDFPMLSEDLNITVQDWSSPMET
ncbi:DgyrCDS7166 [Dimorphilus gyrociliatus]|uniref:DgyrCDS7166 n=1 Tax=Dimorphilus gyrociliatus TaxID=2664684 RepID=A0A7I8VQY8_9ANNE|nr:DgyrCDS7166 [Dimorphilus gyrociliatus]